MLMPLGERSLADGGLCDPQVIEILGTNFMSVATQAGSVVVNITAYDPSGELLRPAAFGSLHRAVRISKTCFPKVRFACGLQRSQSNVCERVYVYMCVCLRV